MKKIIYYLNIILLFKYTLENDIFHKLLEKNDFVTLL